MMYKSPVFKFLTIFFSIASTVVLLTLSFYLWGIEKIVESDFVIKKVEIFAQKVLNMDLNINNPKINLYLRPRFDFSVENLILKKDEDLIVDLKNFDISISYKDLLHKKIKLNKLCAKTLVVKLDKLIKNLPEFENNNTKSNFSIDFYNADICLDELELSFVQNKNNLQLYARDIKLRYENEYKNLDLNFEALISKEDRIYVDIVASSIDEIKIYDDYMMIENFNVFVNNSDLKLNSKIDINNIEANLTSNKFYLKDVFNIINSDFIVENGESMLSPLQDPNGSVTFNVNYKNNDLDGYILINNTSAKIKDLSKLPINITKGKVLITKNKIKLVDFIGHYGKNKHNTVKIYGDIKDYYKTFDSNITVDTLISNEFFKDYLSKLINNTVLYISKPSGTRIIYKAKNNIMDITWLAKISKGVNFGISDEKSPLSDYDRAIKGDFHIENDKIDIKNINYYIAPNIHRGVELTPIIVMDAKVDFLGNVDSAGFYFGREMPCEFLNLFVGPKTFNKGTVKGDMHVEFKNNIPHLKADMQIEKTFIPQQRLFIKQANLITNNDLIKFDVNGGFKRVKYDFKGYIKNELKPPFVIKNMSLDLDHIDVEKFLTSLNTDQIKNNNADIAGDEILDDNYMFDTKLIRIENADFTLNKGNYKELTFGNIKAKLTLDDKGILNIQSNKFDIAQGISTLKVVCDLNKLNYYVRLGIKEIDSNIMAKTLFNLEREISGKASGLIELNSDKDMKLNGNIKFVIKDGTIEKIGLVEYILKIASVFRNFIVMVNPASIMDIINKPEGKFEKITGELTIKDNVIKNINIKSYSSTLSALIRGRFDMDRHDASLRIYTRFSSRSNSVFGFMRNISLNSLANKVQLNSRNDANYYSSELIDLPQIDIEENKTEVFLTQIEGDIEHYNFLSSLKKIK